jgi:hypothetical protein
MAGGKMTIKVVTPRQLDGTIGEILTEALKKAEIRQEVFNGMYGDDFLSALRSKLGEGWLLKKDAPVQFTKEDINAVAASRFFRSVGMTILMGWVIVIGSLAFLTTILPIIPPLVYYILNLGVTIIIFYVYVNKQRKLRKELWQGIDGVSEK